MRAGQQVWVEVQVSPELGTSEMPVGHAEVTSESAAGHTALGFRDIQAWRQDVAFIWDQGWDSLDGG